MATKLFFVANSMIRSCPARRFCGIPGNPSCGFQRAATHEPSPAASQPSTTVEHSRWFTDEVHPHGAQLRSYLAKAFPSVGHEVEDVVQESSLRIWKARAAHPISSARDFLFEVARRLAIDFTRQRARSPIEAISHLPRNGF
jgi:hypothetical protein